MSMISVQCPISGCDFVTGEVPEAIAVALLNTHAISHANGANNSLSRSHGPKLDRPKVDSSISLEEWNLFEWRWKLEIWVQYCQRSCFATAVPMCHWLLGRCLVESRFGITSQRVGVVMAAMKALAVIPVATGVIRAELLALKQKRDQQFRSFSARARGKAETCGFSTECSCPCGTVNLVDYTDQIVRDVLIAGICDMDIHRDILGIDGIIDRPVNKVVSMVEK